MNPYIRYFCSECDKAYETNDEAEDCCQEDDTEGDE